MWIKKEKKIKKEKRMIPCLLLTNEKANSINLFNYYSSMFIRHENIFTKVIYERDTTKIRTKQQVIFIFGDLFCGKTTCVDNCFKCKYDSVKMVVKYYVGLAGQRNRNVVFDNISKSIKFTEPVDVFSEKHVKEVIKCVLFQLFGINVWVRTFFNPATFCDCFKKQGIHYLLIPFSPAYLCTCTAALPPPLLPTLPSHNLTYPFFSLFLFSSLFSFILFLN
jgi:hypothetical protein